MKKVYLLLVLSLFVVVGFTVSSAMAASYTYGEGTPESSVYFTEPGTNKWITGIELASGEEFSFDVWISDVLIGHDGLKIWFLKVWVGDQLESGNLAEYVSFEPLGGFIVEHMELECPSYYGPGWAAIAESFPGPEGDLPLVRLTYKGSGTTTITPASYYVGLYADFGMCDGTELDVGYQGMNVVVDGGSSTNHSPVAIDQSVSTFKNTPKDITLEATDADGDSLTYSIVDNPPSYGTLDSTNIPDVIYTPDSEYTGSDSFTFKANDGEEDSNEATVSIIVKEPGTNNPPVAEGQSVETNKNKSLNIILEATDADGDSLTYSIVGDPTYGTLSGTPPDVTYTPDSDYTGSDSFTFKANDGEEDSNEATVSIIVKVGGGGNFQSINPTPGSINPTPGWEFTFSVRYDVSDGNNELSGIGFYVHYNSRYLEFVEVSNVLEECYGLVDDPEVEDDTEDYDGDPGTNKRFVVYWADITSPASWPGVELPLNLMNVTFKVKEEPLINTSINFSAPGKTAAGHDFVSEPLKICDLDIKANGQDGPITLHSSDTLTITISLDNNGITEDADWWLAVDAPFGVWFYTLEIWTETLLPAYQGPLFYYPYPFKINGLRDIPVSWLRAGTYTFYFAVDTFIDGDITGCKICYDAVEVKIE